MLLQGSPRAAVLAFVLATATACTGNLLQADTTVQPNFPQSQALGGVRRLTVQQYQNSVVDLLGPKVQFNIVLAPDPTYPGTLNSEAASTVATSFAAGQQFDLSAHDIASQIFSNPNTAFAVTGCIPSMDPNDACVGNFLQSFGSRIFRQPMSPRALASYLAATYAFANNGNADISNPNMQIWYGLEQVVAAMLESPYFLYRTEIGNTTGDANYRKLTGYELATRLSYLLWNSTPDDILLNAAATGALETPAGLSAQVERLLASPRTSAALSQYFEEWLAFNSLDTLSRDPNAYPSFTATMGHSMRVEFDKDITEVALDPNADFLEIYTRDSTYVNAELAKLYGLGPVADNNTWVKVSLPASSHRAGLLTMGGYLATQAHPTTTAPVLRGLYVSQNLLCQTIGPPPDNAGMLPPQVNGTGHQTMRQQLSSHVSNPSCAACHNVMDPPGLALENFDAMGAWRDNDQGLSIDASGNIGNVNFTGGVALGQAVRAMPAAQACAVKQFYRQALGQAEPSNPDAIATLVSAFAAGNNNFPTFIRTFVMSDAFHYVQGLR